jgi:hypothetical protein
LVRVELAYIVLVQVVAKDARVFGDGPASVRKMTGEARVLE